MADVNLRCPESTCIGWVCQVDDDAGGTFWGCGECGMVWSDRDELNEAIAQAVAAHPYVCYRKSAGFEEENRPGWVCYMCGSVWFDQANLLREIDEIIVIVKFPYRKPCYRGRQGARIPAPIEQHPHDYDDLVDREKRERGRDFERG